MRVEDVVVTRKGELDESICGPSGGAQRVCVLRLTYAEPRDVDAKQFGKAPALGSPGDGHTGAPKSHVVLRYAKTLGHAFRSHPCPFEGHI